MPAVCDHFLDLIFPETCVFCHNPGNLLCKRCYRLIHFYPHFKPEQLQVHQATDEIQILAHYQPPVKNLIHALKYQRVKAAAAVLAQICYFHLKLQHIDSVCCVPSSKLRISNRGFNQSELIAKNLAKLLQVEFLAILKKIKATARQASLKNREQRLQNIKNAFGLNETAVNLNNKTILLVDDVISTGATVSGCAQILKQAGAAKIVVAAIARS